MEEGEALSNVGKHFKEHLPVYTVAGQGRNQDMGMAHACTWRQGRKLMVHLQCGPAGMGNFPPAVHLKGWRGHSPKKWRGIKPGMAAMERYINSF